MLSYPHEDYVRKLHRMYAFAPAIDKLVWKTPQFDDMGLYLVNGTSSKYLQIRWRRLLPWSLRTFGIILTNAISLTLRLYQFSPHFLFPSSLPLLYPYLTIHFALFPLSFFLSSISIFLSFNTKFYISWMFLLSHNFTANWWQYSMRTFKRWMAFFLRSSIIILVIQCGYVWIPGSRLLQRPTWRARAIDVGRDWVGVFCSPQNIGPSVYILTIAIFSPFTYRESKKFSVHKFLKGYVHKHRLLHSMNREALFDRKRGMFQIYHFACNGVITHKTNTIIRPSSPNINKA